MLRSELDVITFWEERQIFRKSLENRKGAAPYIFLDGPPFVTGEPHLGHISTGYPKDTFPRYWTQKGKYCIRRWGWDCHGLPIENMVQKQLNITDKRQIEEEIGIERFNQACRENILGFDSKWRETIRRSGRWVDMDDQYRTMDTDYMESVWWGLGQLWSKGLLYKDYRVSLYSPSMGASLSHMEINDDIQYVDDTLETPIVRFRVKEESAKKLLSKISEEVTFNYSEQLRYNIDVEKRIDFLGNINKQAKKATINKIIEQGRQNDGMINWDNLDEETSLDQEKEHLQKQQEVIALNIQTLERIKKILDGNKPLSYLVWTTTPWTLPANTALSVGPDIEYSIYYLPVTEELVVLAESRCVPTLSLLFKESIMSSGILKEKLESIKDSAEFFELIGVDIAKIASITGSDMEGLEYNPVFEVTQKIESYEEKAYMHKVYTSNFVTDTEGTGVLHVAPCYGAEDFEIRKQRNLPVVSCLNEYGEMKTDLAADLKPVYGKLFEDANPLIVDILKKKGSLFATLAYTHKYPVFNRDGKKVYYAANENWFIGETRYVDRLIELNEQTSWYPSHLKHGRFQKGLETAPNWCISRNRYWGNPLPIWQNSTKDKTIFIDSLDTLARKAYNPIYKIMNSRDLNPDHYGKEKVVIFTDAQSKLPLGINAAQYRSKHLSDLRKEKKIDIQNFSQHAQKMLDEMISLFEKYDTVQTLMSDDEQTLWTTWLYQLHPNSSKITRRFYFYKKLKKDGEDYTPYGPVRLLDIHRPYIDDILLKDEVEEVYSRIPDVMDCWVESGSMPWASFGYPFEHKNFVEKSIPADYIVEYEGQIRGWFHALHVLSGGIFDKPAFKHVHAHGTTLGYDGKKMSKSKKNYRSVEEYFQKYGSDALRLYFIASPYFVGETLTLGDKEMQATFRDSTLLFSNSISFVDFVLSQYSYREMPKTYKHVLNKWWQAYTLDYARKIDYHLERYELMEASRLIIPYISDFSTWYIRRAKDLLKDYGPEIAGCLYETCKLFSIYSASLQPFNTERMWSVIKKHDDPESVHLTTITELPETTQKQKELLAQMEQLREFVSLVHSTRKDHHIRVRQPLYADMSQAQFDHDGFEELILQECNLLPKDLSMTEGEIWTYTELFGEIKIDLVVDRDLAVLGFTRDFERAVQDFRKKQGFRPNQIVSMKWQITEIKDEEMLQRVLREVNWTRLCIEVKWVDNLTSLDKGFEVKELVKILVD